MVVNGLKIEVHGKRVWVDGKEYGPTDGTPWRSKDRKLELDRDGVVKGDVQGDLIVAGKGAVSLTIEGKVEGSASVEHGDLSCSSVGGSARAGGQIRADKIGGSAWAGEDLHANKIGGSARAGRDLYRR